MKDLGVFIYKLIRKQERRIKMAKLYFRYGAMGSGKTRDLMKTYYNYTERNMRAVIMKPAIDTKGGCKICSRDGSLLPIDYLVEKGDDLFQIPHGWNVADKRNGSKNEAFNFKTGEI